MVRHGIGAVTSYPIVVETPRDRHRRADAATSTTGNFEPEKALGATVAPLLGSVRQVLQIEAAMMLVMRLGAERASCAP
jgi:hypothetical protein